MRRRRGDSRLAIWSLLPLAFVACITADTGNAGPGETDHGNGAIIAASPLAASLDSAARAHVESTTVPGVSVAVVRGGETLLQGGYGFVDLEWDVPTPADGSASYEIGSVTKQFTTATVLKLAEEGRVDLDADFTEYVEFQTGGRTVSVRRLMDHTSGIKGYTEMEVFGSLTPFDLPKDTLVRLVEAQPFDFEPGYAQIYNNSAFFLLGLIIEDVTGRPYEVVVEERLFEPAGMDDSYYCDALAIRDGRANGYDQAGADSLIRARYLDHTWPYAAGSLCSTVGDLVAWNAALHGGGLLGDGSYTEMTTPAPLADGVPIRYGMGIGVDSAFGQPVLRHGGGINGFLSSLAWYPDAELTVAVLQNSTGSPGPGQLADVLAELVLGPAPVLDAVPFEGDLAPLVGTYRGPARGITLTVRVTEADGELAIDNSLRGGEAVRPVHRGGLRWDDDGGMRYLFEPSGAQAERLRIDVGSGHYVLTRVAG